MTGTTWAFVRTVVERDDLDNLEVYTAGKGSVMYRATGADQVAHALNTLPGMWPGGITVMAWSSKGRKTSAYTWALPVVGNVTGMATALPYDARPTWSEFMDLRIKQERLEWEKDRAEDAGIGRIADLVENLAPAILGRVFGGPAPAPVAGAQVNGAAPANLSEILTDVAKFAKTDPAQAAYFHALLKKQMNAHEQATHDNGANGEGSDG